MDGVREDVNKPGFAMADGNFKIAMMLHVERPRVAGGFAPRDAPLASAQQGIGEARENSRRERCHWVGVHQCLVR